MDETLGQQQGLQARPQIEGFVPATNLVVPPVRAADRLAHFPQEIYDLSSESHLSKLLKTMLGDAGAGRLAKSGLLARLQHSLQGTHFFDLDAFYGALFGGQRRISETYDGDPFSEAFDDEKWDEIAAKDDSFRCRMEQFARAINYGPTPNGLVLMAEALLATDCDLYESFVTQDRAIRTYADLEAVGTYGDIEGLGSYGDLESDGGDPVGSAQRAAFTIVPKRQITDEERYDLLRVLNVLKPANSILHIQALGRPHLSEVAVRGAAADSEMWKVRKHSVVNGSLQSKVRPPFASYQGEAWTHIGNILGVTSYNEDDDGNTSNWGLVGVIRVGGTTYTYTPDLAVIPLSQVLGGRAASDGVVANHPYLGTARNRIPFIWSEGLYENATNFDPKRVGSLYQTGFWADGYSILDPGQKILFQGAQRTRQSFWATPDRPQADDRNEVIEIKLRSTQLVNHISFDLSRFPLTATAEAWDEEVSEWRTLRRWSVSESFPQRIARNPRADIHPQHSTPDHWMKCSDTVSAVRTKRIRIKLKRSLVGIAPQDTNGRPTPYSLAIRNLDVGYRLRGRSDIPEPDEDLGGVIATTFDSIGQPMSLDVVQNPASNVLSSGLLAWRSEPQPTNIAVVSLYLDTRTADGQAQVVDSFFIDPVRSGPAMNIYWSDDDEISAFPASDHQLDVSSFGVADNTGKGIVFSDADSAWIEVSNDDVRFDPSTSDWWFGCRLVAGVPTTATTDLTQLFGDGAHLSLLMGIDPADSQQKVAFRATNADGDTIASMEVPVNAAAGDTLTMSLRYNASLRRFYLSVQSREGLVEDDALATGDFVAPDVLQFGGGDDQPGGGYTLNGFFLKVGIEADEIEAMVSHFDSYLLKVAPGVNTNDYTTNAIIRYHPKFSTIDRFGVRGGIADLWASHLWHPIDRDFRLTKGYVKVPPARAKFWKFEFTNLSAEPMESMLPITRHVRVFPSEISGLHAAQTTRPPGSEWPGLRPGTRLAYDAQFQDTPSSVRRAYSLPPTEAQYVPEVQRAREMRERFSWLYGLQPWQAGHSAPSFPTVGPHVYDEFDLIDTSKLGFFVGISQIAAYRTDYTADDDTAVYHERFLDDRNWEDGYTWNLDPGHFFTTASEESATAQSKVFRSRHPVRAIQFAAHQSDATQIVPDDTFSSSELAESDWTDDTKWHAVGDGQVTYRQLERVIGISRNVTIAGREQVSLIFPEDPAVDDVYHSPDGLLSWAWDGSDWQRIGNSIMGRPFRPLFSFLPSSTAPVSQTFGGLSSGLSSTSAEGMIHAAARVTAITNTVNPLVLQIVGSDDTVLAESRVSLKAGETKEWYTSYQLGSFDRTGYQLFERQSLLDGGAPPDSQFGIMRPVVDHSTPDTTGEVPSIAPDAVVRVRVIQEGASTDSWDVDCLSCFDDSILWEFSVDGGVVWHKALNIRSNPNGVLTFPKPGNGLCWRVTSYRPSKTISSLQVRPWYGNQLGTVMGVPQRGPNVSAFDHEPPIYLDPEFKVWSKPVPRWWWLEAQRFPILPAPGEPLVNPNSDFYSRTASEEIDAAIDEAGTLMISARSNSDGLDGDGFPAIGTTLPTPSGTATVGSGIFTRSAASTVPGPEDEEYVSYPEDDSIMRPPLSPPPVAGD